MTELHVQRKRNNLSWIWILLAIVVVAAGIYLYLHYKNPKEYPISTKSTSSAKTQNGSAMKTIHS